MIFLRRKPDKVVVHRIEFQEKERELLEQVIAVNGVTSIFRSITSMDVKTLYALLTLLEALGIIDTPIPTLGDDSIENAINSWAKNSKSSRTESILRQTTGINWIEALLNIEIPEISDLK